MADIFYKGRRINGVTHIGYDPGVLGSDHTVITVRKPNGEIIFIDEASKLSDKQIRKMNRMVERSKHIGKPGLIGRLRYRCAKLRGRTQGDFYWKPRKDSK